jgi:hypothetical protein
MKKKFIDMFFYLQGRMQDFDQGQLSDYNSLSGSNPLTNRVLNKKLII